MKADYEISNVIDVSQGPRMACLNASEGSGSGLVLDRLLEELFRSLNTVAFEYPGDGVRGMSYGHPGYGRMYFWTKTV